MMDKPYKFCAHTESEHTVVPQARTMMLLRSICVVTLYIAGMYIAIGMPNKDDRKRTGR